VEKKVDFAPRVVYHEYFSVTIYSDIPWFQTHCRVASN